MKHIATSAVRKARKDYGRKLATEISKRPKEFWLHIQDGRKVRSAMSELDLDDGTTANTDLLKADK